MSHQMVKVRREAVVPCMTCLLCHKLFRDATTIIECLHTFCRKCIYKKLSDEEMECCPICNVHLGVSPLEKLRADHNLQDVRAKIFLYKRKTSMVPEVMTPITIPAKRKERSLSSLVVSTPRVSTQRGKTGKRSKSFARKVSRGSGFTIEKTVKKEDYSKKDQPESSSSPERIRYQNQNQRQKSTATETSKKPSTDQGRENGFETSEGKIDPWKPLNFLVEAANRSKSSKVSIQGSVDALNDSEGLLSKTKNKEHKRKSKVKDEKSAIEHSPSDSERPKKKMRRVRQKKADKFGEFRIPPQVVVDAASVKSDRINCPIWFSLVASDKQEGDGPPLPQISANFIRIKDGNIPVSFIQKYLKAKLGLTNEDEVEINCMGETINPTLILNNLVDLWLQNTTTDRVSATIGSSAKDFVMVLSYARRVSDP